MRVLIVKTSSLGDIVHTLPALTDAQRALPFVKFDWVAEEAFAEIPGWHPAVVNVIPVAIRRWRKAKIATAFNGEWRKFKRRLREQKYDCVIDAQGLIKSAMVARRAHAPIVGLDSKSAREPLASWCYQRKVSVPWDLHAVERVRSLFAQALEYPRPTTEGDYGIDKNLFIDIVRREPHVLFLHGTTRADKHWPDVYWQQLCQQVGETGMRVLLPWGNAIEHERAQRIAAASPTAQVLPRLNLHSLARIIATSTAVVAVDTGLGHLSAALDIPTVSLYGPTDPARIGTYGKHQIHLRAHDQAETVTKTEPQIMAPLTPSLVWNALQTLLPAS
ncbi:MAG: rfaC [Verrucomicrobiaceae bacterium]|nr:rfaC [Verrucomicrobiaceae bacterium]